MRGQDWEDVTKLRKHLVVSTEIREEVTEKRAALKQRKAKLVAEIATKKALLKLNMLQKVAYGRLIAELHYVPVSLDMSDLWKELGALRELQREIQLSAPPLLDLSEFRVSVSAANLPQFPIEIEAEINKNLTTTETIQSEIMSTQTSRIHDLRSIMRLRRQQEASVVKSIRDPASRTI